MKVKNFNAFCASQPHATHVVQWGGSDVWKIGGKVFAIGALLHEGFLGISFKCTPLSFQMLVEQEGCHGAPYLASRGMKWIQRISDVSLDDAGLQLYINHSYRLALAGLPKKKQKELCEHC